MQRFELLDQLFTKLNSFNSDVSSLSQLNTLIEQFELIVNQFDNEHDIIESTWPKGCLEHEYFAGNWYLKLHNLAVNFRIVAGDLKTNFTQTQTEKATSQTPLHAKLPDISLPTFEGSYQQWPSFINLFHSLILNQDALSDVEKFHYLKGCLKGHPAQLISGMALAGDSLQPALDLLTERFENNRLLIQPHLDKSFGLNSIQRNSESLNETLAMYLKNIKALEILDLKHRAWDIVKVFGVFKLLDRSLEERWETSIGPSTEYPRFDQFEEFLRSHARAVERIESLNSYSSSSTTSRSFHHGATQLSSSQESSNHSIPSVACDCCNGNHNILMCSEFYELSLEARLNLIKSKRLCYNCLGRHTAQSCKGTRGCDICSSNHHTMLHELQQDPGSTTSSNSQGISQQLAHQSQPNNSSESAE